MLEINPFSIVPPLSWKRVCVVLATIRLISKQINVI